MRIVQIKLESEDPAQFMKQSTKARIKWIALSCMNIVAMGLDSAWSLLFGEGNKDVKNKMLDYIFVISVSSLSVQLVLYTVIIIDQWSVFLYYVKKKKERA